MVNSRNDSTARRHTDIIINIYYRSSRDRLPPYAGTSVMTSRRINNDFYDISLSLSLSLSTIETMRRTAHTRVCDIFAPSPSRT